MVNVAIKKVYQQQQLLQQQIAVQQADIITAGILAGLESRYEGINRINYY
jgi:hypothetical protein